MLRPKPVEYENQLYEDCLFEKFYLNEIIAYPKIEVLQCTTILFYLVEIKALINS